MQNFVNQATLTRELRRVSFIPLRKKSRLVISVVLIDVGPAPTVKAEYVPNPAVTPP